MDKKIFTFLIASVLILMAASNAYCDDPIKKFGRGIANVITSPLEIVEQTKRTNLADGPVAACTSGILKGVAMIVVRAAVGVYEIVSFPVPMPANYAPILKDPEYFFEETIW